MGAVSEQLLGKLMVPAEINCSDNNLLNGTRKGMENIDIQAVRAKR